MHIETVNGENKVVYDEGEQAKAKSHERIIYGKKPIAESPAVPIQPTQPIIPVVEAEPLPTTQPLPSASVPIVTQDTVSFDGAIEKMLAQRMKQVDDAAEIQKKQIVKEAVQKQKAIKDGFYSKLFSLVNSVEVDSTVQQPQQVVRAPAPLPADKKFLTKPKVESVQKKEFDWKTMGGWMFAAFSWSFFIVYVLSGVI